MQQFLRETGARTRGLWQVLAGKAAAVPLSPRQRDALSDTRDLKGTEQVPLFKGLPDAPTGRSDLRVYATTVPDYRAALNSVQNKLLGLAWAIVPRVSLGVDPDNPGQDFLRQQAQVEALLRRPCPKFPSFRLFKARCWEDLLVEGESAAEIVLTGGQPVALLPMAPEWIRLTPWGERDVKPPTPFLEQHIGGLRKATLDYEQVLWMALNMGHDRRGLAPGRVLANVLLALKELDGLNREEFSGDGRYARKALLLPNKTTASSAAAAEEAINQPRDDFDEIPTLWGHEYEEAQLLSLRDSNKDMEMPAYRRDLVRQVANAYGLSLDELGFTEDSNRSVSQTLRAFANEQLRGLAELDQATMDTLCERYFPLCQFVYTDLAAYDPRAQAELRRTEVGQPWKTRNEIRAEDGLDPIEEWEEEDRRGPVILQLPPATEPTPPPTTTSPDPEDAAPEADAAARTVQTVEARRAKPKPSADDWHAAEDLLYRKQTRLFAQRVAGLFGAEGAQVAAAIESAADNETNLASLMAKVDTIVRATPWAAQLQPLMRRSVKAFGEFTVERHELGIAFNVRDPRLEALLATKPIKLTGELQASTIADVRRVIEEGLADNVGVREIAKRIEGIYDPWAKFTERIKGDVVDQPRSMLIARTELQQLRQTAAYTSFEQAPHIVGTLWQTNSANPRPTHATNHGEKRRLGETFPNGLRYPGDPAGPIDEIANCMCSGVPLREEDFQDD